MALPMGLQSLEVLGGVDAMVLLEQADLGLQRGLGGGKTMSLDRVMLTAVRLGLTGRPNRLIISDGTITVEEWESARTQQAVAPGTDGRLLPTR